jgi:hypothetical protein
MPLNLPERTLLEAELDNLVLNRVTTLSAAAKARAHER